MTWSLCLVLSAREAGSTHSTQTTHGRVMEHGASVVRCAVCGMFCVGVQVGVVVCLVSTAPDKYKITSFSSLSLFFFFFFFFFFFSSYFSLSSLSLSPFTRTRPCSKEKRSRYCSGASTQQKWTFELVLRLLGKPGWMVVVNRRGTAGRFRLRGLLSRGNLSCAL